VTDGFFWIGNHPGLDLLNTEAVDHRGARVELLGSWHDVVAWAEAAGIVTTARHDAHAAPTGRQARSALDWARRLRAGARQTLDPEANDPVAGAHTLAEAVADVPVRLVYQPHAQLGTASVATDDPIDKLRLALALAVLDATQLDRSRVRRCESEQCVLLFYDTSKNRSRRWCDMAACGNRAKAAAHYQRLRQSRRSRQRTS
jgi:predicted RNA-binding Zn ribbon-like protein